VSVSGYANDDEDWMMVEVGKGKEHVRLYESEYALPYASESAPPSAYARSDVARVNVHDELHPYASVRHG